ncbi:unnamed protein product [Caenorhabditis auriculariae]|uniref:Uncharacterized protein n=1 Tax=Caenorhabditis auriculariae TaxID=2777116 RepID=A0A8S1HUB5_9PELO|nr:unnamed protein product [Caenorhabditis auriculariae]
MKPLLKALKIGNRAVEDVKTVQKLPNFVQKTSGRFRGSEDVRTVKQLQKSPKIEKRAVEDVRTDNSRIFKDVESFEIPFGRRQDNTEASEEDVRTVEKFLFRSRSTQNPTVVAEKRRLLGPRQVGVVLLFVVVVAIIQSLRPPVRFFLEYPIGRVEE